MNSKTMLVLTFAPASLLVWSLLSTTQGTQEAQPDSQQRVVARSASNGSAALPEPCVEDTPMPPRLAPRPGDATQQPANAATAPQLSQAEQRALVEQTLVEAYPESASNRFGDALATQAANPTWTAQITTAAKDLLQSGSLQGTQLLSVDCRETMCEMRFAHRDIEAEREFWHSHFTADGPWADHLQGGPKRSSHDAFESFVYFANDQGADQFTQIDQQISEDTQIAVTQALAEHGIASDNV